MNWYRKSKSEINQVHRYHLICINWYPTLEMVSARESQMATYLKDIVSIFIRKFIFNDFQTAQFAFFRAALLSILESPCVQAYWVFGSRSTYPLKRIYLPVCICWLTFRPAGRSYIFRPYTFIFCCRSGKKKYILQMVRAHRAQYFFAYTLEEVYPCTEIGAGNVVIDAKTVTGNQLLGSSTILKCS